MWDSCVHHVAIIVLVLQIGAFSVTGKDSFNKEDENDMEMERDAILADEAVNLLMKNPKARPKCAGPEDTYCTKSNNYPTEYINNLLKIGVLSPTKYSDPDPALDVTRRVNLKSDFPLCGSRQTVIAPLEGFTDENEWLYIANTKDFRQQLRVETCIHEKNTTCSLLSPGLETQCEQKYQYRTLTALRGSKPDQANFKFPSCCVCRINKPGRYRPRHKRELSPKPIIEEGQAVSIHRSRRSRISMFTVPEADLMGSTYCLKSSNYPKEHIKKLIKQNAFKGGVFIPRIKLPKPTATTENRRQGTTGVNYLCQSYTRVIYPEAGRTITGDTEYIVQELEGREQLLQGVTVELCDKPETECLYADRFPYGYTKTCKQKFVHRELISLDANGNPKRSTFYLPSCCVCSVNAAKEVLRHDAPITPIKAKN